MEAHDRTSIVDKSHAYLRTDYDNSSTELLNRLNEK